MKIHITHFRFLNGKLYPMSYLSKEKLTTKIDAKGGATKVQYVNDDGTVSSTGYSFCQLEDSFVKSIGLEIASRNAHNQSVEKTNEESVSKLEEQAIPIFEKFTSFFRPLLKIVLPDVLLSTEKFREYLRKSTETGKNMQPIIVRKKIKKYMLPEFRQLID